MSESLARLIVGPGTDKDKYPYVWDQKARVTAYAVTGASTFHHNITSPDIASMPFLVIQIFHKANDHVRINLGISTSREPEVVLSFSTDIRATGRQSGPGTRITLQKIPDNKWVNVCFDLDGLVVQSCPGETFQSLNFIEIRPSCLIRHIFSMTKALKPGNEAKDVPNKFKIPDNVTVRVARNASPKTRKVHSQGLQKKVGIPSQKRAKTGANPEKKPTTQGAVATFNDDFIDDDEEEDDSDEAFSGAPPSQLDLPELDFKRRLPENEEEELELVYIEVLNCYYCPNNQQYYQIDSEE